MSEWIFVLANDGESMVKAQGALLGDTVFARETFTEGKNKSHREKVRRGNESDEESQYRRRSVCYCCNKSGHHVANCDLVMEARELRNKKKEQRNEKVNFTDIDEEDYDDG